MKTDSDIQDEIKTSMSEPFVPRNRREDNFIPVTSAATLVVGWLAGVAILVEVVYQSWLHWGPK